jgi:membrane-bound lytic murein transglycosylase B
VAPGRCTGLCRLRAIGSCDVVTGMRLCPRVVLLVCFVAMSTGLAAQEEPPRPSFDVFLADVRAEAAAAGVSESTLARAFDGLTPEPVVVSRDRNQPETVQSLDTYLSRRLTSSTVNTARQMHARHRRVLDDVSAAYGVPASVLVSIWGLESNFGRFTGSYSTIRALATLAWDNRRPLFRAELIEALRMVDAGVPFERMKGSWAGAMGQPQFMPSSFRRHAVDFDGDGSPDIWGSLPDVFASMANYLRGAGWTAGERWGREVAISREVMDRIDARIPVRAEGCRAVRAMTEARPLEEWRRLGVRLAGGGALPVADMEASLVRGEGRHFLVYRNYHALLDYNCSHSYALAVALLSDRVP